MTDKIGLIGIHHITAITSDPEKMYHFMTEILGLRLALKTVDQQDTRTYHLFFTDDIASPGSDLTFFDFPQLHPGKHGKNAISIIGLRVKNDAAIDYWQDRFDKYRIKHNSISNDFGDKSLDFYDFDTQHYRLISDEKNYGLDGGVPVKNSEVDSDFAIIGLGRSQINTDYVDKMDATLTNLMGFKKIKVEKNRNLYELNNGGHGAQLTIRQELELPSEFHAWGNVHHIAFRTQNDKSLEYWVKKIRDYGLKDTGIYDRHYLKSEYFRPGRGILFEIATDDAPGVMTDQTYETAGQSLSLPPFLEAKRIEIEQGLKDFKTK